VHCSRAAVLGMVDIDPPYPYQSRMLVRVSTVNIEQLLDKLPAMKPHEVATAMKDNPDKEMVLERGLSVLADGVGKTVEAAATSAKVEDVSHAEGIDPIAIAVGVMKQYKASANIQTQGCRFLLRLSEIQLQQPKLTAAGGVGATITAMTNHEANVEVQEQGCIVLHNLGSSNASSKTKIASLRGIQAIVKAMDEHLECESLQLHAIWALQVLIPNRTNQDIMAASGGIEQLLKGLNKFPMSPAIQDRGCRALGNLAYSHAENQKKIMDEQGFGAVLDAMATHQGVQAVQEHGCRALKNFSDNNSAATSEILRLDGANAVVRAMDQHVAMGDVQEQACFALRNLLDSADGKGQLQAINAVEAVQRFANSSAADSVNVKIAHEVLGMLIGAGEK